MPATDLSQTSAPAIAIPDIVSALKSWVKYQLHSVGRAYMTRIGKSEWQDQCLQKMNERPIEYEFVLRFIRQFRPENILDVGTGESALPRIMRACGPKVTAIDNIAEYWPRGMHNRFWHIVDKDITADVSDLGTFDLVTCISTVEHIVPHARAMANMVSRLKPGGHLLVTCPYNENQYCENVYALPESCYFRDGLTYVGQNFSKTQVQQWIDLGLELREKELWKLYNSPLWTVGEYLPVPERVESATEVHNLGCFTFQKV